MNFVNPSNHYWTISGATGIYASKTNTEVATDDADYLASGREATPIESEAELGELLRGLGSLIPAWLFNAPSFIQPAVGVYTPDQLKAYGNDARWRKEQGGITATAGFPIKTNDRSQAKITGLYAASKEAPAVVTPYHAADGSVQQLDAAGMYALNSDLLVHINNCFEISADVHSGIDAGSITTLEQIDAAFDASITRARKDWLKKK